ncbi:low-density lipoprotein receptor-related protein 6-like [Centruroides sculpturatus]|uniref:low-density lipoprotein receptor-related protein 6-like n=1 Tax=Centruroides sculpturatus TaxID=218467 RepID=UPI000C6CF947|nr:low-density lipoprotein receptor-related protein 6-like [Centruroides sculpturatus]
MIRRAYLNGSEQEDLITTEVHHPDGIAIDWIARNLYWTDTGTDRIEVSRLNGTSRKILITENLDEPRAIVLDPVEGYMYWTDWGSKPMIERAELDGTHRTTIINTSLDWPNGLAIDYEKRKLYWGDAKLDKIEMANLDGSDRRVLVSDQLSHIFGFSLLGDFVYWTDWQQRSIERVHKETGDMRETIIDQLPDLMGLKAVNIFVKHGTNPCAINNGNCSNLCLNKPENKYICSCPMGLELASDLRTCIVPEAFLLFSRRVDIRRISLESKHNDVIPISGITEASALDYDINDDRIYWTDVYQKTINRAFMNGSNVEHIIEFGLQYPEGMAVDWIAHNLYWTDMGSNRIEVSRLDGSSRKVLLWQDLDDPRSIALDPSDGLGDFVYWTDWQQRSIERVHKETGDMRETIIDQLPDLMGLKAVNIFVKHGTNPCAINNGNCSNLCLNKPENKYICSCPMGLELASDLRTCIVPEAFLLFSRRVDIRRISLESKHNDVIPISGITEASALDYDINDDRIYWTDVYQKTINRAFMNGSNVEHIIEFGLQYPEGMAVDWIAHNLYWTDMGSNRIEVSRLDGLSRKVLLWQDLDDPRSIALDPSDGYMYWSDWGSNPRIEKSAMDGSDRTKIISKVKRANGLTIDYTDRRIFWIDIDSKIIESADLTGGNRQQVIPKSLPNPHALTQYQGNIYWSDWDTRTIERASKITGENQIHIQKQLDFVVDIVVYHTSRQSGWNPCAVNNGGCSHLCLALPSKSQHKSYNYCCACPSHYELASDNKTCLSPKNFILFSQKNNIGRMIPDLQNTPEIMLPISHLKHVRGLEYDYIDKFIYWIDGRSQTIRRGYDNGTKMSVVVQSLNELIHPIDMAIEPYSRSLYWSCARHNVINVTKLNGKAIGIIISGDDQKPRHIAIHPNKGYNFVIINHNHNVVYHTSRQSGWNPCAVNNGGCSHLCLALPSKSQHKSYNYCCACPSHYELASDNKTCLSPKNFILFSQKNNIGRMIPDLQNTPEIMLPISHLKHVRGLEYDYIDKFIYWIDGRSQTIRRGYDNGTKMSVVVQSLNELIHPIDMAIEPYSRSLYWSCARHNVINVTKLNGKAIGIIISGDDQKPRHIAIHPNKGLIFWTNLMHPPRIEKSSLDGLNKQIIIKDGLTQPGALAVDIINNLIFWSDLNAKTIETADLDGSKRQIIVTGSLFQPVSLTVLGDYLYWIDKDQQIIERVNKLNGKNQHKFQYRPSHLTDIVAVSPLEGNSSHPCFVNNGGCSHLCIMNDKGEKYCSCPIDLILEKNEKTCINPPVCGPDQFRCQSGKMSCIPEAWRCDGFVECDDMLDELNCTECKSNQYKCKNDKCIDPKLVCDGVPNCPNGEDEACCQKDQYYCAALKKCISLTIICQTEECSESLDEASLHCKQVVGLMKMETSFEIKANYTIGIVVAVLVLIVLAIWAYFCKRKTQDFDNNDDTTEINMSNKPLTVQHKSQAQNSQSVIIPINFGNNNSSNNICMGHLPNSCQMYDQNHVVGGSSTSSMDTPYPQETLNPPPSPVTVLSQCTEYCCSSHTRPSLRSYKYQRAYQPPPPPTPCSTDVCDDSEPYSYRQLYYNIRLESSYDSDPYPPPPTPRSHYFSDDNCGTCPPSPSTVRSFYNPLPPPPSPVPESDS